MSFQNPAGLWLLLLVPLLILIYIIRSRYEDRSLSSTYIWKLSDRFLKKKLPLHRFFRILLFLLQLLLIVFFALAAAKPMVKDGLGQDYVVILDCSAEMQIKNEEGVSRFERAVKKTEKLSKDLAGGHTLTVILAGQKASYLIKNTDSAINTKTALEDVECGFGPCNLEDAMTLAQEACARLSAPNVLFYTYRDHESVEGLTVENLSQREWDLAFSSLHAVKDEQVLRFTARLCSYNKDAEITVGLSVDGKTVDAQTVRLKENEPTEVIFEKAGLASFDCAEVYARVKDGFEENNLYALCPNNDLCKVLLASSTPFYLKNALDALGNCKIDLVTDLEKAPLQGYDLYLFDNLFPEEFPTDGAVLLFGCEKLPAGLICASTVEKEGRLAVDKVLDHPLFEGVAPFGCYVKSYTPLLGTAEWIFLMYCTGSPVFAVKNDEKSPLFAVCSFDLHHSNLPLQMDFIILMKNVVTASLPSLVKDRDYVADQTLNMTVPLQTQQLYIEEPDGTIRTLSFSEGSATLTVSVPGCYTAAAMRAEGEGGVYADFFVHVPEKDTEKGEALALLLPEKEAETRNKESDIGFWVALAILLLMLIEWGVYYREQY